MSPIWRVNAFQLGTWSGIPGPELFWMSAWSEKREITLLSVIAENDAGEVAVVNTGPNAADLPRMNAAWAAGVGPDCALSITASVTDGLDRFGHRVSDVRWVLCTPFQAYTVGNIALFEQARVALSGRGWRFFFDNPYPRHPHDEPAGVFPPHVLTHLVYEARERLVLLDDAHDLAPGLRTRFTGGHHRASIGVSFTTGIGEVVVSDTAFLYENVEQERVLGISENIYESLDAYRWFREAAAFVPLYDPEVLHRYPDGRVA